MTILYRLTERESLRDLKEDLQSIKNIGIERDNITSGDYEKYYEQMYSGR